MMNLYDTHAHLQSRNYDKDRGEVIRRTKAVLRGVLIPGYDIGSSRGALALRDDFFKAAVGIHPHYAADFKDRLEEIRFLASSADAVGEIGLDYYRNLSPKDVQKDVFYSQLLIATELKKPIVIHEREAFEDVWDIITGVSPDVPVIFHCFSHGAEEVKKVLSVENFIPAFCGNLTYRKADNLREAFLEAWKAKRFFFETDCPYLSPVPMRGKRNEPRYVAFIYEFAAKLVGEGPEVLADITHHWWSFLWG